ncbi:LysM peptidoglycan-binding domain-containing protein [Microbacterium sp. MPKO10]|uniref:muramidase family protein n=1 Tax=Microbacterium sp. MPKO10 TaxID=2989818 RepID=UPI002235AEAB|nr:LysM peptidoglycan-binding domain-containing protein [Microbacterium sp. MPKO10]MCW4459393.1 LysM peptidoglycan-binding domain-containing protein [Microbacterium sp. MPKO10]
MSPAGVTKSMVPIALLSAVAAGMHIAPAQSSEHRTADYGPEGFTRGSGLPRQTPHFLPAPASYTVGARDSLAVIATRFGLDAETVAALNGLATDSAVHAGQTLALTKKDAAASPSAASADTTYVVQSGDTVSRIASRHDVSTQSLLDANGLSWSSVIYPGQKLTIPGAGKSSGHSDSSTSDSTKSDSKTSDNAKGSTYTVVSGDTPSSIASAHGISIKSLLDANGLSWSSVIYPGQKLTIPGAGKSSGHSDSSKSDSKKSDSKKSDNAKGSTYTVVSGDTVSGIASAHGISIQSLLDANGLTWTSIIYVGQKLTIPGSESTESESGGSSDDDTTPLTAEMKTNAQTIIRVGRSLGVSDYGLVIALAAAMQESSLRNVEHGDRDSLGLFQQRTSQGWGTKEQIMNPEYAAKVFFVGVSGKTRGLLDIAGWKDMSVSEAAQAVQISAYPEAYGTWEASARSWLAQLG